MNLVITGLGMVSALGGDVRSSFDAFVAGHTARRPLQQFDPTLYRVRHAYQIDGPDEPGRPGRWLAAAVEEALSQAGLPAGVQPPALVGTGLAEQRSMELWHTAGATVTLDDLHFAGALANSTGLSSVVTFVNACAASLSALAAASDLLALGEAEAVVVAGTDGLSESMFGLLDRVNPRPPAEVRPFDAGRVGVILGEGAAAVVLERADRAAARGAVALATLRGVAATCDAYHVTAPLRSGIGRAFTDAYQRAGVRPEDVDLVFAHGTGTVLNDATEAEALGDAYAAAPSRPAVTALKSLIGHTSGASGLMSLITAVCAMADGQVPPTRNHTDPIEPIRPFPVVTGAARHAAVGTAQVDAFGFGGVNAVAVLERPSPTPPTGAGPAAADVVITGTGVEVRGIANAAGLSGATPSGADFDPVPLLGRRGLRYKDRATLLALCAATKALTAAGLSRPAGPARHSTDPPDDQFGVVVSTDLALLDTVCRVVDELHAGGVVGTSPMDLPNVSGNVAASQLAIWFGLGGVNLTVSAGATSGLEALRHAAAAIRAGRVRRMLVVGVEPDGPAVRRLLADTAKRHGGPVPAAFDGAAAVVLEAADPERRPMATLRRYDRSGAPTAPGSGLWGPPCAAHGSPRPPAGVDTLDLSGLGEARGAYGVLQVAAAADLLAAGSATHSLLTAGGCWGAPYASLTLEGPRC
ncbi:beta-ketoacyl synthase N-terminal-like domain-containing protein [Micromonospora sp. NPDC049044]|uniref:beta-ketoacyl synthase N-terminal-like domain-containing protein n=1 Tax=Micromonospora sp. NPDC049044 TaxID=3154827 RepID=UPI0033DDE2EC